MRLLDTETMELTFIQRQVMPRYAILSHVWDTEEVTFQDMANPLKAKAMHGYAKLTGACTIARRNGIKYIWIDTCCINKESSTELSEAINSMYKWYARAAVCYAYLADVSSDGDHRNRHSAFAKSQWFTRGWTLQELIAPRKVIFLSMDWLDIGTKATLQSTISFVTGISPGVIVGRTILEDVPIAVRMSWAADRNTTREEDTAYSLMGLFDVNMPLLYGEGRKAFFRLQYEIIKKSPDHSIFVWKEDVPSTYDGGGLRGLLARSPAKFRGMGIVERNLDLASDDEPAYVGYGETSPYSITNRGLSITLPIVNIVEHGTNKSLAFLNCHFAGESEPVSITLQQLPALHSSAYFRVEATDWRKVPEDIMEHAQRTALYAAINPPPRDRYRVISVRLEVDLPVHYQPTITPLGCRDGQGVQDRRGRMVFEKQDEANEAILVFEDYTEFGGFAVVSSREGPLSVNILSATEHRHRAEWRVLNEYLLSPTREGIRWEKRNRFLDRAFANLENGWSVTVNTFDHDATTGGVRIDLRRKPPMDKHLPALPSSPIKRGIIRRVMPPVFTKVMQRLLRKEVKY